MFSLQIHFLLIDWFICWYFICLIILGIGKIRSFHDFFSDHLNNLLKLLFWGQQSCFRLFDESIHLFLNIFLIKLLNPCDFLIEFFFCDVQTLFFFFNQLLNFTIFYCLKMILFPCMICFTLNKIWHFSEHGSYKGCWIFFLKFFFVFYEKKNVS